jgi:putative peptide zinc metalloprotease protein
MMDGRRTVQQIWDQARQRLAEEAPTQDEVIRLLTQLHSTDALRGDVPPDSQEMERRFDKQRRMKLMQNLRSPLFMRFPLLDPERFLERFKTLARPMFGWSGLILWLIAVAGAVFQVSLHWPELTGNILDRVLAPANLVILWLTFPILKALHEFGHAFAVKVRGGEVHEMGIMLLVFTPIPYVDASAASAFRKKRERMLVGLAGLMVELFLAALAVFVWVNAQPGPVRAVAFNVMFIAGVSSVLFNGNPLLRYDAYYVLTDLVEVPNLGSRGIQYVSYLFQRYLLRMKDIDPPESTPGERFWFLVYTPAAFAYRVLIYGGIVLFVASKFFFIGVLFAIWALINMVFVPLGKIIAFLAASPKLYRKRAQAIAVSVVLFAALIGAVAVVPVPLGTISEGVLWVPEDAFVRAGTNGFVDEVRVAPGAIVKKGDPLLVCADPLLPAQIQILNAQLGELRARYDTEMVNDRVAANITRDEIAHTSAKLDDARQRMEDLTIRAGAGGTFAISDPEDFPGRFLKRGELVGYVIPAKISSVRAVVSQGDVDMVRNRTLHVQVRLAEELKQNLSAVLRREVPAATEQLPSKTLSMEGGGKIAVDPRQLFNLKAFQKIFLFDVALTDEAPEDSYIGGRVYVRFDHGKEPLVWRWYRTLRQLFLKRFNV